MKFYINPTYQNIVRSISTIIAEIIIPYFLINGFINIKNIESFSKVDTLSLVLLVTYWIFLSYIKGRYSQFKSSNILKNLILEFRELIIVSSFATISLFIFKIIGINHHFDSKNIPLILFSFISLSLSKEIIISFLFEKILIKASRKVSIIGNDLDLKEIKSGIYLIKLEDYTSKIIVQ